MGEQSTPKQSTNYYNWRTYVVLGRSVFHSRISGGNIRFRWNCSQRFDYRAGLVRDFHSPLSREFDFRAAHTGVSKRVLKEEGGPPTAPPSDFDDMEVSNFNLALFASIFLIIVGQGVSFYSLGGATASLALAFFVLVPAALMVPFTEQAVLGPQVWAVVCAVILITSALVSLGKLSLTFGLLLQVLLLTPVMTLISQFLLSVLTTPTTDVGQPLYGMTAPAWLVLWGLLFIAAVGSLILNQQRLLRRHSLLSAPVRPSAIVVMWLAGVAMISVVFVLFGDHIPSTIDSAHVALTSTQGSSVAAGASAPLMGSSLGRALPWPFFRKDEVYPLYPFSLLQVGLIALVAFSGVLALALAPRATPVTMGSSRETLIGGVFPEITSGSHPETGERDTLIKEIHHRVKNNLQLILSFTNLQMRELFTEEAKDALQFTRVRIRAIALIHELLYSASDFRRLELRHYLERLCNEHASSAELRSRTPVVVSGARVIAPLDVAIPACLAMNELLSHVAQSPGIQDVFSLTLHLSEPTDSVAEVLLKLHGLSAPAVDASDESSLALRFVHTLMTQIDGEFSTTFEGTQQTCRMRFKV